MRGKATQTAQSLFIKNLVRGGTAPVNVSAIPPRPLASEPWTATPPTPYTREGGKGQDVGVARPHSIRVVLVFVRPYHMSALSFLLICFTWNIIVYHRDRTYVLYNYSIVWESVRCERMFETVWSRPVRTFVRCSMIPNRANRCSIAGWGLLPGMWITLFISCL